MYRQGGKPPYDGPEPPLNLVALLLRAMNTIHSLDEMFQWIASTVVQRFGVSLAQFWLPQINEKGQISAQLLVMERQDLSVPERVVANDQMARMVERVSSERRASILFLVEQAFPPYHAALLNRYGFNYCGCSFLESSVSLSRLEGASFYGTTSPRFAIATLLLLRQLPRQDPLISINTALEQGLVLAANRGFTFSSEASPSASPPPVAHPTPTPPLAYPEPAPPAPVVPLAPPSQVAPQPDPAPQLEDLIPRRKQDPDLLTAKNPFTSVAPISDKQARRLHTNIDGRRTVAELCSSSGMSLKDAYAALQVLLKLNRIELYDSNGRPVKASLFFQDR